MYYAKRHMFKTKGADWLFIVASALIWMTGLVITARDFRRQIAVKSFHCGWLNGLGLGLMVGGVGLRMLARKALGKQFSYALRTLDDHTLLTNAIYNWLRHPAYTGDLMFHFGIPILFASPRGLLIVLLLIPCMLYRIEIEENMLIERFGEAYRSYRRRSKKLIPFVY